MSPEIPVLKFVSGQMTTDTKIYIVLDYMPPFPREDTVPQKVVVWCPESDCMLRFRDEPIWDMYGEDYETVEAAKEAIAKAPKPRKPYVTFTFPLGGKKP